MSNKYYAVVHLFGKNSSDKREFVREVPPGKEIEVALELYKEVNRILNFYGVDDSEKFLGRVGFSDVDIESAASGSHVEYKTKESFYHSTIIFLQYSVIPLINEKLFLDKKPIIIDTLFDNYDKTNQIVLNLFAKANEFYEFSNAFGTYVVNAERKMKWVSPLNLYAKEFEEEYIQIIEYWGASLEHLLGTPKVVEKLGLEGKDLNFVTAFAKYSRKVHEKTLLSKDEGALMRWIMDNAEREKGEPSPLVYQLLSWDNSYNL